MLWLFYSHIYGNLQVFKNLLELSEFKEADRNVCLGPIVRFGNISEGQELVELVRNNASYSLKGPSDVECVTEGQCTEEQTFGKVIREIFPENTRFLRAAQTITSPSDNLEFLFANSRLDRDSEHEKRIWDDREALEEFSKLFEKEYYSGIRFIFSGYSRTPSVFDYNSGNIKRLETDKKLFLDRKGPYLISPGDLSRSDGKGTYAIFEDLEKALEIKSI